MSVNLSNILKIFNELVERQYNIVPVIQNEINQNEKDAADTLLELFDQIVLNSEIDEEVDLEFQNDDTDQDMEWDADPDYIPEDKDDKTLENELTLEEIIDIVADRDKHPDWKFETFRKRHRKVRYPYYIAMFRNIIARGGTNKMKLKQVNEYVLEKFTYARNHSYPVHDKNLRTWAAFKANQIDLKFKASAHWIMNFKNKNRITSRKAKIVTSRSLTDQAKILESAEEFRKIAKIEGKKYTIVLNTDQMGFNKELHSSRTLSHKNEKTTFLAVRSLNNCTHSYTVQPIISLDGKLMDRFLLCLYEPSGRIGPRITIEQRQNVVITCSRSGKLEKGHIKYWIEHCLKPATKNENFLLLLDSWGTQTNRSQYEEVFGEKFNILVIPPKTTAIAQPLDVHFNFWWKYLARRIADKIILDEIDVDMGNRNNIIKEQSLIHNQLSSPKFENMIKYAFFKSGITEDNPGCFENLQQVCFPINNEKCAECDDSSFIRCSHCEKFLCFKHFFLAYHFHN